MKSGRRGMMEMGREKEGEERDERGRGKWTMEEIWNMVAKEAARE